MRIALIVAPMVALAECGEEGYLEQEKRFVRHMENNRLGDGADYWIMTEGAFGGSRIGLIFGYPDDASACEEAVQMMNERYGADSFFCEAAN